MRPQQPISDSTSPAGGMRDRVIDVMRRGRATVGEIASALGITKNGVRFHLEALERDGTIQARDVVRTGTAGKPAVLYELTEAANEARSKAYAPVLAACVAELGDQSSPEALHTLMLAIGARLAAPLPKPEGDLRGRVQAAATVLDSLGAVITIADKPEGTVLEGGSCPLASVVAREPLMCVAVRALLVELIGAPVVDVCNHTARPQCRFIVPHANAA